MITQKNFIPTMVTTIDQFYRGCSFKVYASQGDDIFLTKHTYHGKEYFCVGHNEKLLSSHEDLEEAVKQFNHEI